MSEERLTIWTVGHSTRTLDQLLDLLSVNAIEILADVRRFPASRKYPHFNQDTLRNSLLRVGVEYVPLPELGGFVEGKFAAVMADGAFRLFDTEQVKHQLKRLIMRNDGQVIQ